MSFNSNSNVVIDDDGNIYHSSFEFISISTQSTEIKILASDGISDDKFGYSVAVGSEKILVGAQGDESNRGGAYMFNLNGNQIAKITASDGAANDRFGSSVAVGSGRIVVGASGDDSDKGAAYIFDLNGTQITKITASDGAASDFFGNSVAVNSGRIVVGAYGDNTSTGAAYIYNLAGTQLSKITASDPATNDEFGFSVATNLGKIIVGARYDDDLGSASGSAYIFDLSGYQVAKIKASDGAANDRFGSSVAVGSGRIVVGAPGDESNRGAAYIFDLTGSQIAKITASDGVTGDEFGCSVSVGSGVIVIGASKHDVGSNTDQGSAYVYNLNGNQLAKLTATDGATNDQFGFSVSVYCARIIIGAYVNGSSRGASYIYKLSENHNVYFENIFDTFRYV